MSESQTVTIPMGYEAPAQPREQPRPQWARKSIHNVRMSESIMNSHRQPESAPPLPYTSVEQPAQNYASYQPPESYMENNGNQQPQAPQRPDSSQFDMWDEQQAAEYHRQNDAYMEAMIDRRVQAALTPSRQAQNEAEAVDQYNRAVEKYGADENFKSVMEDVLQLCARDIQTGKPLDIEARYREVSESTSRRPDQRLSHLPTKAKTVTGLGQLIEHNHRTGRAKPFGNRNWRG